MRWGDLFAGLGGASHGLTAAGHTVVWAANHWPAALQAHAAAHPSTLHVCQDLQQADFHTLPPVDGLWASPACQGHARARGRERPHHDAARATAWAVVAAAEAHRPAVVVVENVREFRGWALYPAWRSAMAALGYHLQELIVDAADLGVPQHRVRLFVVATRRFVRLELPRAPHRPVVDVLDLEAPMAPLVVPGRAERTIARARASLDTHGPVALVGYYSGGGWHRSVHRPIGALTTRARWAVVRREGRHESIRMLTPGEAARAMGWAEVPWLPSNIATAHKLIGNAVSPPVAKALALAVAA